MLSELLAEQIDFIVVGGSAAILGGVMVVTDDLDIVHRRTPGHGHLNLQVDLGNAERDGASRDRRPAHPRLHVRRVHGPHRQSPRRP